MTIAELGSLGEFFASLAVLITLVFLVIQMRQNTSTMRRTNARHAFENNSIALAALLDEGVSELFIRGLNSLDNLSEVERYRFDAAFTMWLQACEQTFIDYRDGTLGSDQVVVLENAIPGYLSTPGGSVWWKERQVWFSHAFRDDVTRLCSRPPVEAEKAGPKLVG